MAQPCQGSSWASLSHLIIHSFANKRYLLQDERSAVPPTHTPGPILPSPAEKSASLTEDLQMVCLMEDEVQGKERLASQTHSSGAEYAPRMRTGEERAE